MSVETTRATERPPVFDAIRVPAPDSDDRAEFIAWILQRAGDPAETGDGGVVVTAFGTPSPAAAVGDWIIAPNSQAGRLTFSACTPEEFVKRYEEFAS